MKPLYFLIQDTGVDFQNTNRVIDKCKELGVKYKTFGVIPFSHEITNIEPQDILEMENFETVVLCSTLVVKLFKVDIVPLNVFFPKTAFNLALKAYNHFTRGIDYNPKRFDFSFYQKKMQSYKHYLYNTFAKAVPFEEALDLKWSEPIFIKPGPDLKYFKGTVLEPGVSLREHLHKSLTDDLSNANFNVVWSDFNPTNNEYRFFIVGGNIMSSSTYFRNGKVDPCREVPKRVVEFAEDVIDVYQPADSFVMDIAEDQEGRLGIMEYNCINASGLYEADLTNYVTWSRKSE